MLQSTIKEPELIRQTCQLTPEQLRKLNAVKSAYRRIINGASKSQTVAKCIEHVYDHVVAGEQF